MMRRRLQIALLALLALGGGAAGPRSAAAARVAQSSAADYHFHKPALSNHIQGVVMGWPPEYRVIRSEDIDWLREAWNERNCIATGTTNIPSSYYNYYSTNIVAASPAIVQQGHTSWFGTFRNDRIGTVDDGGWLDGSAPLLNGARVIDSDMVTTNDVTETAYTNTVTNAFSTITMPMTNGTESVYTNQWTWERSVKFTRRVAKRHVWTALDWCQPEGAGPFPGNTGVDALPGWYSVFPSVAIISNAYANLRSTVRLADVGLSAENGGISVKRERVGDDIRPPVMNDYTTKTYELLAETDENGNGFARENSPEPRVALIRTRFLSALNQIGGAERIDVEAVFVIGFFQYSSSDHSHDVATPVVVRLSSATLDTSGPHAYVQVRVDARSVGSAAASAAGAPGIPAGVGYQAAAGTSQSWSYTEDTFVIIYRITPSVKLTGW